MGPNARHARRNDVPGGQRFLITSAPERRRPSYIAFLNTLTGPLSLLPLAGAWLAKEAGMTTFCVVVMGGGLLFLANTLRMDPPADGNGVEGRPRRRLQS